MSTYTGSELPDGSHSSTLYAPDQLDVDQWVCVARDAGMKYAVLTTKHVAGHCLWPTRHNDCHVGTTGNKTDVVETFVKACEMRGVLPGFYCCSWDNHNRFGSRTPSDYPRDTTAEKDAFTTSLTWISRPRRSKNLSPNTNRSAKSGSISLPCFLGFIARNSPAALRRGSHHPRKNQKPRVVGNPFPSLLRAKFFVFEIQIPACAAPGRGTKKQCGPHAWHEKTSNENPYTNNPKKENAGAGAPAESLSRRELEEDHQSPGRCVTSFS